MEAIEYFCKAFFLSILFGFLLGILIVRPQVFGRNKKKPPDFSEGSFD